MQSYIQNQSKLCKSVWSNIRVSFNLMEMWIFVKYSSLRRDTADVIVSPAGIKRYHLLSNNPRTVLAVYSRIIDKYNLNWTSDGPSKFCELNVFLTTTWGATAILDLYFRPNLKPLKNTNATPPPQSQMCVPEYNALWGTNINSCFHKLSRPSKCVNFNVRYLLT